jgi:light-regulated signal transduction histidine kinase (bacteriophytochrome)
MAKKLFMKNCVRVIGDSSGVEYKVTISMISGSFECGITTLTSQVVVEDPLEKIDLTNSHFRGVSQCHRQYLRNMGVR